MSNWYSTATQAARQIVRHGAMELRAWPRAHLLSAASLSLLLLGLLLVIPPTAVEAKRSGFIAQTEQLDEPVFDVASIQPASGQPGSSVPEATPTRPLVNWKTDTVRRGDNLSLIFQRAGLDSRDVYELLGSCPDAKRLNRVHPGHKLAMHIENGQLQKLRYEKSELESWMYRRDGESFAAEQVVREPQTRVRYSRGQLKNSLFLSGKRAGLSHRQVMQLANVFGGVIDFIFDARNGDRFNVMFEELYLDGKKIGEGNILAAEYINLGKSFTAYRYENEAGEAGYFSGDGESMQKAFMRAPLDFTRISSSFNLRRVHPIHKKIRAHRGTDYVAPTGTPIYAAGDGRVKRSGYSRANGNYIVLSHGTQYTTKYLHLSKRRVQTGKRVKKGQVIGNVGSTGYSTGPHLHYEFLVNGVHRNPRTIIDKLPKAHGIAAAEMPRFEQQIAGVRAELAQHQQANALATLGTGDYSLVEPDADY